jgi:hypothetical protein
MAAATVGGCALHVTKCKLVSKPRSHHAQVKRGVSAATILVPQEPGLEAKRHASEVSTDLQVARQSGGCTWSPKMSDVIALDLVVSGNLG